MTEALPGSNAWAIGPSRSASGNAILVANPHLPWGDLFTWFEVQLTSPDIDAYGATLVGAPFELFHRIKRRVQHEAASGTTLVLSLANGAFGYAPEREAFEAERGYAAKIVPFMVGVLPFTPDIEDELVEAMCRVVRRVRP